MRSGDIETLALRLAEAMLLYKGEISIRDIEAIPFLSHPRDAELIAEYLRAKFKTKASTVRKKQEELNVWEELITLVK
jgi:hypothetical protein